MKRGVFIGTILLASACAPNGCGDHYSDGERTGTVVKFSNKGFIYKSWEGSLHLGQAQITGGNDTWDFSTRDPAVIEQLKAAQSSGSVVTLHYHQWIQSPWMIDTDYEVDSVK